LEANCYLAWDKKTREGVIIDPGDEPEVIMERVAKLELKPGMIMATHGHFDHVMGVNELKLAYNTPFLIAEDEKKLLSWARRSAIYFTKVDPGPAPKPDKYVRGGDEIEVGSTSIKVLATPGHSPGGLCLYCEKENILFSGDTIFAEGAVGRTDFPYCDKAKLKKSVERLLELPPETKVYPGHGKPTTIRRERAFHTQRRGLALDITEVK